jgi:hypothetical protein
MTDQTPPIGQPYEIESVSGAEPPPGAVGTDWYKYVIVQGKNTIQGHRQGKLSAVTSAVEEIVMQLNERRLGRRGRVNLVPTPKKRA